MKYPMILEENGLTYIGCDCDRCEALREEVAKWEAEECGCEEGEHE